MTNNMMSSWVEDNNTNSMSVSSPSVISSWENDNLKPKKKEDKYDPNSRIDLIRTILKTKDLAVSGKDRVLSASDAKALLRKPLEDKLNRITIRIDDQIKEACSKGVDTIKVDYPCNNEYDRDLIGFIKSYFSFLGYKITSEVKENRFTTFTISWV